MAEQNNKDPVENGIDAVQNTAQAVNTAKNASSLLSGETFRLTKGRRAKLTA